MGFVAWIVLIVLSFLVGMLFTIALIDYLIKHGRLPMGLYRQKDIIKKLINEKEGGAICVAPGSEPG